MRGVWLLALVAACGSSAPPAACVNTPPEKSTVRALATTAAAYGRQFVVDCVGDGLLGAAPETCAALSAMTPGLHRDSWQANYLNFDDASDPEHGGLLDEQTYVTLMLGDPSAYKGRALLAAYELDGDAGALATFRQTFLPAWLDKQLPSAALGLGASVRFGASATPDDARDVTLDATGAFAQAATLAAGADGRLGTADDVVTWRWNGHSPLHTAVLADALAAYQRLTSDGAVVAPLDAAGRFLVGLQRSDGAWAYAIAPAGAPPDALTTAVTAMALASLGRAPLPHASDFAAAAARATAWLQSAPLDSVGAGAAIALFLDAGDTAAASRVADALLARMTTPAGCGFGDHGFAGDAHALGGIAGGGAVTFQSPWPTTYAVAALLRLAAATGQSRYRDAADLAVAWLADKIERARAPGDVASVQDLRGGVAAVADGGWWGLVPEGYEPDATSDNLPHRVLAWVPDPSTSLDQRPQSWLERETGTDEERILAGRVRADPYFAHISYDNPWSGGPDGVVPVDLGHVSPGINPLTSDDAALALFDYLQLR